jgi:tetratricopeptide (TPR) repeat protein
MAAIPDDPDVPDLRNQAIAALVRAAERAQRTGAPATATRLYTTAARLHTEAHTAADALAAARLDERAGDSASTAADLPLAQQSYARAADAYRRHATSRDVARAITGQGRALRRQGQFDEAVPLLRDAITVLSDPPDADTVHALTELATLETFAGRDADQLWQEALDHAQALDLSPSTIADLFIGQGIAYDMRDRPAQAVAVLTAAVNLTEPTDDTLAARALLNQADVLMFTNPAAGAEAAKKAVAIARRIGDRYTLDVAVSNLVFSLLHIGDWDGAQDAYGIAVDDGLADRPYVALYGLILGVLRNGVVPRGTMAAVETMGVSQDAQDHATLLLARTFGATVDGDVGDVLRRANLVLSCVPPLSVGSEPIRWAWPLAADAALTAGDLDEGQRLLDWLDGYPRGHVPPVLRAERARIAARLLSARHDPGDEEAYADAVTRLRELGSPYHLAVGLLDYADHLSTVGNPDQARLLATEASTIAEELRAQPLLRRALRFTTHAASAET